MEKTDAVYRKRHDAEKKAEDDLRLAREGLKAAQSDEFGEEIERATLTKTFLTEVQSVRAQFEKETQRNDRIQLKERVAYVRSSVAYANRKIKQHQVLLKWIEQQRYKMTHCCANMNGTDQLKQDNLKAHPARRKAGNPWLNGSSKTDHRRRTTPTETSILKPAHASKVIKPTSKRRSLRQRARISCSPPQQTSMATAAPNTFSPRKMETLRTKDEVSSLRSVRSSRISKLNRQGRPSKSGIGIRPQNVTDSKPPPSSSARQRTSQRSADMALRRSTRVSRRPERFRPR